MAERSLVFDRAEFQRRTGALQAAMAEEGLDALLLTAPGDIFYVTGFLTRFWESPARPWFILVPSSGSPVAVIPSIGVPLMQRCWIDTIHSWDAPDPHDDGISLLVETLSGLVPGGGVVGVPMGLETHLRMPLGDWHRFGDRIAPRRVADATAVVHRVREIKSEVEIERIRSICVVAGRAFDRVGAFARAGVPLSAVFREFQRTLLEEGADWVSYVAGSAGPGGYGDVIAPADDRPLAVGDVLMLDTGAVRDGYFCDFDRNFSIGPPDDGVRRAHECLHAATDALLDQMRPGMRACEAHAVLCSAIKAHGGTPLGGRLGHGLGVTLTEWPSFTALDTTTLRENMVLTIEPGLSLGGDRILVHEENIVLRADGAELLSPRAPRHLPELDA